MFLAVVAVVVGIVALYVYLQQRSTYFERRNIPAPKVTSLFTGNLDELYSTSAPFKDNFLKWRKQFGETFGYLEGGHKVICTSNTSIIRDVFVRKFDSFHSRKLFVPYPIDLDTEERINIFMTHGLKWKRLRALGSPGFTINKLKILQPVIINSTNRMLSFLHEYDNKEVNVMSWFFRLTGDIIERISMGRTESAIAHEDTEYLKLIREFMLHSSVQGNPLARVYVSMPELLKVTKYIHKGVKMLVKFPMVALMNDISKVIDKRREVQAIRKSSSVVFEENNNNINNDASKCNKSEKSEKKTVDEDMLDSFLKAETSEADLRQYNQQSDDWNKMKFDKKLSDQEIVSMCIMLLIAGMDTTANSMSYLMYLLSTHQDVQDKLVAEVDTYIFEDADANMDVTSHMDYLDWCIKESLRLFPVASVAQIRQCMQQCTVGDNDLVVEKNVFVAANTWDLHYDPKYWGEDAAEFNPDRWNPSANRIPEDPFVYQPFGLGPRTCLGVRLARVEMKMIMCLLLKQFRVFPTTNTTLDIQGTLTVAPKETLVRLVPR